MDSFLNFLDKLARKNIASEEFTEDVERDLNRQRIDTARNGGEASSSDYPSSVPEKKDTENT